MSISDERIPIYKPPECISGVGRDSYLRLNNQFIVLKDYDSNQFQILDG